MTPSEGDRRILRDLANRVAEIASLPIQAERTRLWKALNSLGPERSMVLALNQLSGYNDPMPVAPARCQDPLLRGWENAMRLRMFEHERISDDHVVTDLFGVGWVVRLGDIGLRATATQVEATGSRSWEQPLKDLKNLAKLHCRSIEIDRGQTARNLGLAQDLFGDILRVRVASGPRWRGQDYAALGGQFWSCGLTFTLARLRGIEQTMLDLYDHPQFVHDLMAFLRDDMLHMLTTFEDEGVLALNNNADDYIGSGALGAVDELPAPGFESRVRLQDMWGLSESQDFAGVGPDQWYEFCLRYELPLINRFGLACYGCCEPLDKKYDLIIQHIPRLRRVSVTSPFANLRIAAEKLGATYVLSWKPSRAMLYGPAFDVEQVERTTREVLRLAKEHHCCLEIVMKGDRADYRYLASWAAITSRLAMEEA